MYIQKKNLPTTWMMDYLFVPKHTQPRKGKYHIEGNNKWAITTMNR
jgi:hypothetical protein